MTGQAVPSLASAATASPGGMNVDYEQRVSMDRLRGYRLGSGWGPGGMALCTPPGCRASTATSRFG